eukprot:COSAG06_NODE_441_length_15740_cov_6.214144_23_plen_84_part_00
MSSRKDDFIFRTPAQRCGPLSDIAMCDFKRVCCINHCQITANQSSEQLLTWGFRPSSSSLQSSLACLSRFARDVDFDLLQVQL